MPDRQTCEKLFLEHLGWIRRVASMACSKASLWDSEAEDFTGWIQVKLMDDDYAVFRNFRGESGLRTYLASVVTRQFQEYRRQRFGRWRPSTEARRLGPPAPDLEALVRRDGYRIEQAGERLRTAGLTTQSDVELARILARLPDRAPLRPVEVAADAVLEAEGASRADDRVAAAEAEERRGRVERLVEGALDQLAPEDRMIVRMHFMEGRTIAQAARVLKLDQKPLYRRVERLRLRLRKHLEDNGVHAASLGGEEHE